MSMIIVEHLSRRVRDADVGVAELGLGRGRRSGAEPCRSAECERDQRGEPAGLAPQRRSGG